MKSLNVTIQLKSIGQYSPLVLFLMLLNTTSAAVFSSKVNFFSVLHFNILKESIF